jgi:putative ABC transport system substrate-binding protein
MKRRELIITLLGGAAAWPLAARAQPGGRMRRVSGSEANLIELREIEAAAASSGVQVSSGIVRDAGEIESVIEAIGRTPNAGLIITPGIPINDRRKLIFALANRYRLPAVYIFRFFAVDGGLLSYGPDILDEYRRSATYVDRILKGEKPSDLPVQAPVKYELVINLHAAKAIGLDVPPALLPQPPVAAVVKWHGNR